MVQWVRKERRLIWPCCPVPFRTSEVRKWHKPSSTRCLLLLRAAAVAVLESHINIWSFFIAVRFWAVPVSWRNGFHSNCVLCEQRPFSAGVLCEYLEKLMLHLLVLHLPCRERTPACMAGRGGSSGNQLWMNSEFENNLKENIKYSATKGCCRKGIRSYSCFGLLWCKTWEEFCMSFAVKLHFKHIYHLAFDFHECSSCRVGGGTWCTVCGTMPAADLFSQPAKCLLWCFI